MKETIDVFMDALRDNDIPTIMKLLANEQDREVIVLRLQRREQAESLIEQLVRFPRHD
jgi:hypothetical protein